MNIQEKILHNTLRNATKIVSFKPRDNEGENGDFAVGNTSDGVKLFSKVKNKWYSFGQRTINPRESIFGGSVNILQGGRNALGPPSGSGIPLLGFLNTVDNDDTVGPGGQDNHNYVYVLPYDTIIKKFLFRFAYSAPDVNQSTITIELYTCGDGNNIEDDDGSVITDEASVFVESVTLNMKVNHTSNFQFNQENIIPKGNIIYFRCILDDGVLAHINWSVHLESHE